ncbi:uncharacterized protein LOC110901639 [Helianthus annuus]|uniref:uncharacterized protein LOC110901639 n=1 Tax=Helianthus annuus TaxID=4232 RepID=UPI001653314F|nr:uncharacterized protein LOC110901639 [Helianthus annuus]
MDPQSSTGRNTDVDFEDAEFFSYYVQLADERVYIPEVETSAIPVVGMQFNSIEQAYAFYQHMPNLHMLPAYRQLSEVQEEMIWELGTLNVGPVKAFHIMRKRYGGFEKVGATVDDCKNFRARINSYIGEYDADMVINRLTDKKEYLVDFSFEYSVDEDKRLTGLFWADGLCKRNFTEFGDVGYELYNNEDFKRKMCDIVWTDSIEPEVFEREWKLVMIEFGLTENKWIDDVFVMKSMWIPDFYRHKPMSGFMRTTSRSESSIIERMIIYQDILNLTIGAKLLRKQYVAKVYTRSIFFDQQTEIYGTISECLLMKTKIKVDQLRISMKDFKVHGKGFLEVCFKKLEEDVDAKDEQYKAKQIAREIMYTGEYLVNNLITDLDQLVLVRDQMKEIKEKVDQSRITRSIDLKYDRFSKLIGYQQLATDAPPTVRVPTGIRNKGRSSHKWIKSKKEQMISHKGKRIRTCSVCNGKGHDIWTCEVLKGKKEKKMKGIQIDKDPSPEVDEVEISKMIVERVMMIVKKIIGKRYQKMKIKKSVIFTFVHAILCVKHAILCT